MADAGDSGAVQTAVRCAGSGYLGKSNGYTVSTEQSDRVLGAGHITTGYTVSTTGKANVVADALSRKS